MDVRRPLATNIHQPRWQGAARGNTLPRMREALKLSATAAMTIVIVTWVTTARWRAGAVVTEAPEDIGVSNLSQNFENASDTRGGEAVVGRFNRPLRGSPNSAAVPARHFAYSYSAGASPPPQNYPLRGGSRLSAGGVPHSGALRWSMTYRP
jgi:hypothetical protein